MVSTTKKYMPNKMGIKIKAEIPKVASKEMFWMMAPAIVCLVMDQYIHSRNEIQIYIPKKNARSQHTAPDCDTCTALVHKVHIGDRGGNKCLERC